ncbi:MAG: nickel-responsive transcriptional regulator NikR, partial [Mucispirillum sp.]|nr:nickel-responsive transcriptional regulator NikR [Mucispirillum sp.]
MAELTRFGVSLDRELLERFDTFIKNRSYETRSKAISDLIKESMDADIIDSSGLLAGAVTFLYSHHNKDLVSKLLEIQHDCHDIIISM